MTIKCYEPDQVDEFKAAVQVATDVGFEDVTFKPFEDLDHAGFRRRRAFRNGSSPMIGESRRAIWIIAGGGLSVVRPGIEDEENPAECYEIQLSVELENAAAGLQLIGAEARGI